MSKARPPTATELAASEWLVRMRQPNVTAAERRRFEEWLAQDESHARVFDELNATWAKLDVLAGDDGVSVWRNRLPPGAGAGAAGPRGITRFAPALAASAALALAATAFIAISTGGTGEAPSLTASIHETAIGEHEAIHLDDGSTIQLNAASRIEIEYTTDERRVRLAAGGALFDVAHNPVRPFIVETPQGSIIVRGTSFVVDVGPDEVRTTVLRGVVEAEAARAGWNPLGSPPRALVHANEEVAFGAAAALDVVEIAPEIATRRIAWREHMLSLDGETLREAAAEVTRQTGVQFEFSDPSLGEARVGGYISVADETDFVDLLETSLRIDAEPIAEGRIRLRPSNAARR